MSPFRKCDDHQCCQRWQEISTYEAISSASSSDQTPLTSKFIILLIFLQFFALSFSDRSPFLSYRIFPRLRPRLMSAWRTPPSWDHIPSRTWPRPCRTLTRPRRGAGPPSFRRTRSDTCKKPWFPGGGCRPRTQSEGHTSGWRSQLK
jgi:hypothetical protein